MSETEERLTEEQRTESLRELGFEIESSAPLGHLEPAHSKEGKPWPCIRYQCRLLFKGSEAWAGPYSLGIGHVDPRKGRLLHWQLSTEETQLFEAWQSKPHADFRNKALQATIAGKLAKVQKVAPTLPSVLHSLLLDAQAHDQTFEQWCAEYGYDTDSRRAEETWKACDAVGRMLKRVPAAVLEKAREVLADY